MKKKIIIGVALAAAFMLGAGAGYGFRYIQQPAVVEAQTEISTEAQSEPESETETETTTSVEPETETSAEPETEATTTTDTTIAETTTGTLTFGVMPQSADDFIIAENADQFFEKSVFIGDSVMMGFRNFIMGQPAGFLGSPEFLVSGSFSARMALSKIAEDTIHPIYQGEQHYIWDSISMMEAEKAFLFFGLNDIGMKGVDGTSENYIEVIEKIKEVNPEVDIYVISTTNMLTGSEKGDLNNVNIGLLNDKMRAYCKNANVGYIDIANFLVAEDGGLKPEFCSDAYVHQTEAAYEIWTKVLRGYASGGMYTIPVPIESETTSEAAEAATEAETNGETTSGENASVETTEETTKAETAN